MYEGEYIKIKCSEGRKGVKPRAKSKALTMSAMLFLGEKLSETNRA